MDATFHDPPRPGWTLPVVTLRGSTALAGLALLTAWMTAAVILGLGGSSFTAASAATVSLALLATYVIRRRAILSWLGMFGTVYTLLFLVYPIAAYFLGVELPEGRTLAWYTFLTCGGLFFLLAGYHLVAPRDLGLQLPTISYHRATVVALAGVGLLVGISLLVLAQSGSLARAVFLSRSAITTEAGGLSRIAPFVWVVGSVGIVMAPTAGRRYRFFWPVALLMLIPVTFLGFIVFRTRSSVAFVAVALVMGTVLARALPNVRFAARGRPLGRRTVMFLFVVGLLGLVGGSYLRFARGLLEERGLAGLTEVEVGMALRYNLESGDLGFAPVVFDVIETVPDRQPRLNGQSYLRILYTPVPRSVWPEKPENTQRIVASWLRPEVPGMTIPPGIQGDLYINFGLLGVLGFIAFGGLLGVLDRQSPLTRMLCLGAGFVPIFHLARGGFTNPLLLLAAVALSGHLIARYLTGRRSAGVDAPTLPATV